MRFYINIFIALLILALVVAIIWLLNSGGVQGNPLSKIKGTDAGTAIPVTLSQSYSAGSMVSVDDANAIYDYYTSQGMNNTDASAAMVNYIHAQGLLVPPGL